MKGTKPHIKPHPFFFSPEMVRALCEGIDVDTCERVLRKAAGRIKPVDAFYAEDADENDLSETYCYKCAKKAAGRGGSVHRDHGESDGPAFCDKCYRPLWMSLTDYGIERELYLEDDPGGKSPEYFAAHGSDAAVAAMLAHDLTDPLHVARLSHIAFATMFELANGKGSWSKAAHVWPLLSKLLAPARPRAEPTHLQPGDGQIGQ